MKTKINISIETKNVAPVYDDNNNLIIQVSEQLEQALHTAIEKWIKENLNEEQIIEIVNSNYYDIEVLSSIGNIEDVSDLKVVYNNETLVDILRFIPPEEQIVNQESKVIDLEDKVEVPKMEFDTDPEEEDLEEYDEDEKETEDETEESI